MRSQALVGISGTAVISTSSEANGWIDEGLGENCSASALSAAVRFFIIVGLSMYAGGRSGTAPCRSV